ncbi:hypothetical protein Bccel_3454 [Pseudobacteroides cellulosolvens ATCC 35603 = DSM 2933]|uniref:Uncharacterized protein n=1 Tax=Pseudobacteroides cellulosolvens ATCC 35603 = DSM 2933 TaxID=398512 RepID=A0A0L6JR58_9FIRM|nr:hypothetical protein Bccel_3454 [Pseudobacteroides cellulosolvens ATCC 35603 = DSM 2933]
MPREASLQCLNLGLGEKAVYYAKAAVELDRENDGLHANYGLALLINKQGNDAFAAINKVLEMNNQDQINKNIYQLILEVISGNNPYPDRIGPRVREEEKIR